MKSKLLIVFVLFFAQQAYSQFNSGDIFVGGSFQFNSSEFSDERTFNLSGSGFYLISENIAVGSYLGLNNSLQDLGGNNSLRTTVFEILPAARYFSPINDHIIAYGEVSAGLGFGGLTGIDNNTSQDVGDVNTVTVALRPGIMSRINDKIAIDLAINLISFQRQSYTAEGSNTSLNYSTFNFGAPKFSLYFFL